MQHAQYTTLFRTCETKQTPAKPEFVLLILNLVAQ